MAEVEKIIRQYEKQQLPSVEQDLNVFTLNTFFLFIEGLWQLKNFLYPQPGQEEAIEPQEEEKGDQEPDKIAPPFTKEPQPNPELDAVEIIQALETIRQADKNLFEIEDSLKNWDEKYPISVIL